MYQHETAVNLALSYAASAGNALDRQGADFERNAQLAEVYARIAQATRPQD